MCLGLKGIIWAFAVRAAKLWNFLPAEIRSAKSITAYKSLLKTFFIKKKLLFICELFIQSITLLTFNIHKLKPTYSAFMIE